MPLKHILVKATWDGEAGVYVAESEDAPGLITEAETPEALVIKLKEMIPELLVLNGVAAEGEIHDLDLEIEYRTVEKLRIHA